MKSKKTKVKTRPKAKSHSKKKSKTQRTTKPRTAQTSELKSISSPSISSDLPLKTCQEVEVGDIGGFGSTQELEQHEKRCNEPATELCSNCGKNVCRNHYDLIHRDHDTSGHTSSQTPA